MSRKYLLLGAIVLGLVASASLGAWAVFLWPVKVEIAVAERDVPVDVFGLGTVEARVTSKVGFKVSGILVTLHADVRDRVPKGSVLARLDDREQNARVGRAKAAVDQSGANLQRATASLEKARANYANAKNINERRQALLQSSNTSIETAQTSKAVEDAAFADVNLALSDVEVARASINDAKAQSQQEAATLDFHTLASPYDAVVIARLKELGSALASGEPVFTLIDPATIWVLAYIDESKSGEIQVGNAAEIVLRSLPGQPFHGRVARIEPEGDRVNEERRIEVAFDRLPDDFHLGEQAEIRITTVLLKHAILVPEAAVLERNAGRGTVWLVDNGRLAQGQVTFGHRMLDGRLEIVAGVPEGAFVINQLATGLWVGRAATTVESQHR